MLSLIKPGMDYKKQYIDMIKFWESTGENLVPWVLSEDYSDFASFVQKFEDFSHGIEISDGFVQNTTYWIYETTAGYNSWRSEYQALP